MTISTFSVADEYFQDAEMFLDAFKASGSDWLGPSWVFRGQGNAAWSLLPSVLRTESDGDFPWLKQVLRHGTERTKITDANKKYWRLQGERQLVLEFREIADRSGLAIPEDSAKLRRWRYIEQIAGASPAGAFAGMPLLPSSSWPPDEFLSLLALAQHQGVPTRLLDFTWKHRVAAYFAARFVMDHEKEISFDTDRIAVWALNTEPIYYLFIGKENPPIEIVQAPQAANKFLAAQAGLFMLCREEHEGVGLETVLLRETGNQPFYGSEKLIRKLTLPVSKARDLMTLLAFEHVTAATVFPGYSGVVQAIRESNWWSGSG